MPILRLQGGVVFQKIEFEMRCLFILFHHRELSGCGTVAKQERTDDHCYRYGFGIIKKRPRDIIFKRIAEIVLKEGYPFCVERRYSI